MGCVRILSRPCLYNSTPTDRADGGRLTPDGLQAQAASSRGKPHIVGEVLVLPSIKNALGAMFGEKVVKEIERMPLSNNTLTQRIDEKAQWAKVELMRRGFESTLPGYVCEARRSTNSALRLHTRHSARLHKDKKAVID
ncbi:hypothetical protein EVAR_14497_1 [Eumeta japonica]|uniref:Uncharacterized protein n=1 Tax=Eumeta variegata TaxID=151549 RepID=A0A4C1U394_EUMVA|nr:hypothetical protein EVAR_14497_1 [Eumeta japonica]